ncbi:hypothetical protein N431DRAFT_448944 [Stipitochalara longipes BDJ]|nr:hypothetical protein N431DRAFT_448944 [Stipitochalara longipes BDJ]
MPRKGQPKKPRAEQARKKPAQKKEVREKRVRKQPTRTQPTRKQPPPTTILRKLPPEIRLRIYPHVLAQKWNNKLPNLLLAFREQPDLYAEAKEIYLEINREWNESNDLPVAEHFKLKHLMMSCQTGYAIRHIHSMRGNLLLLSNSLISISLDLKFCHDPASPLQSLLTRSFLKGVFNNIREMSNASNALVRIAVRMPALGNIPPNHRESLKEYMSEDRRKVIEWVNNGLGVKGKMEHVSDTLQGFESWFWERMDVKGARLQAQLRRIRTMRSDEKHLRSPCDFGTKNLPAKSRTLIGSWKIAKLRHGHLNMPLKFLHLSYQHGFIWCISWLLEWLSCQGISQIFQQPLELFIMNPLGFVIMIGSAYSDPKSTKLWKVSNEFEYEFTVRWDVELEVDNDAFDVAIHIGSIVTQRSSIQGWIYYCGENETSFPVVVEQLALAFVDEVLDPIPDLLRESLESIRGPD